MPDLSKDDVLEICLSLRHSRNVSTSGNQLTALKHGIAEGKLKLFSNEEGKHIEYVLWGDVVRETLSNINATGRFPLYQYEWSEGNIMLFMDAVFTSEKPKSIGFYIRPLLRNKRLAAWYKRGKLVVKVKRQGRWKNLPRIFD
jgi:hemolysin-activating ACP:hemolysin acyltransferase